jgi:hypothetical protein
MSLSEYFIQYFYVITTKSYPTLYLDMRHLNQLSDINFILLLIPKVSQGEFHFP